MGSIGAAEILVVLVLALIVLGPTRLPDAARSLGKALAEFRRVSGGLQAEVRDAFSEPQPPEPTPVVQGETAPPPTLPPLDAGTTPPETSPETSPELHSTSVPTGAGAVPDLPTPADLDPVTPGDDGPTESGPPRSPTD